MADQIVPGNLFVDDNAGIGTRSTTIKLEVNSGDANAASVVGICTTDAQDFVAIGSGHQSNQNPQIFWNRGSLSFATAASFDGLNLSERIRITDNGDVGIGISNPGVKLQVNGSVRGDQNGALRIDSGSGFVDVGPQEQDSADFRTDRSRFFFNKELRVDSGLIGSHDEDLKLCTAGSPQLTIGADGAVELHARNTLLFNRTNASGPPTGGGFRIRYDDNFFGTNADGLIVEKTDSNHPNPDGGIAFVNTGSDGISETALVIRGSGNVGIGTTSPGEKLEVNDGEVKITNQGDQKVLLNLATERSWQFRQLGTGAGTALELASVGGGGNKNLVINTKGRVGIGTTSPGGKLEINDGEVKITNQGNQKVLLNLATERSWQFRQLGTGAGTALELASVGGGGNKNFVINTKGGVGIGSTSPRHPLHMGGGAFCDGRRWQDVSSIAYKEKVTALNLNEALAMLAGLEPVIFNYKGDHEDERHVGFIAEAVPELVASKDRNGLSAMHIVAVVTRVVQEQQHAIEAISKLRR